MSLSNYTYTQCHTYNISITNHEDIDRYNISRDQLQNAYDVAINSSLGTAYRIFFGFMYLFILSWSAWQYLKHVQKKKLWLDNRQIVVLCILSTALLRSLQFFLKEVTDCNAEYEWIDELFTALETIAQFNAFTLLISFWIELQLNVKQGLKSLQKLKNPTIILLLTFFVVRMSEFAFIISPLKVYSPSAIRRKATIVLICKALSVCLYGFLLVVAGYWGYKLLTQLRAFERKTRERNERAAASAATRKSNALRQQTHSANSSTASNPSNASNSSIQSPKYTTDQRDQRGSPSASIVSRSTKSMEGVSESALAKQRLFNRKVLRMTLFMILEIITYVLWLILYAVLFFMRAEKPTAKIGKPRDYLAIKFVEKSCEWLTIVVLCFTMIASSQSRKARKKFKNLKTMGRDLIGTFSSPSEKVAEKIDRSTGERKGKDRVSEMDSEASVVTIGNPLIRASEIEKL